MRGTNSNPARVVADADVLAADLLVGGDARAALDHVRRHSWVELVASDRLLDEAQAIVAGLADDALGADWRERIGQQCVAVEHPPDDHPALASAYRGDAAHLLSFDDDLASAETGVALRGAMAVSVRHPAAFAQVFDPESLYVTVADGAYPGPDRDPRA